VMWASQASKAIWRCGSAQTTVWEEGIDGATEEGGRGEDGLMDNHIV
jgi:hypothetical protein